MTVQFTIGKEAFEGLSEAIQAEYTVDGTRENVWNLDVEGAVAKGKVDEFRNNNIALTKENDTLKTAAKAFDGIDPGKYKTLVDQEASFKDKKVMTTDEIQELIDRQVNELKATHKTGMEALTTERDTAVNGLNGQTIDRELRKAAKDAGILPEAIDDALLHGRQVYFMKDGQVTPFEDFSQNKVLFSKDGLNNKSPTEWMQDLAKAKPHLAKSSDGGSQQPGSRNNSGVDVSKMTPLQKIQLATQQRG